MLALDFARLLGHTAVDLDVFFGMGKTNPSTYFMSTLLLLKRDDSPYFSAMALSVARPVSKSLPTMLSMLKNICTIFAM